MIELIETDEICAIGSPGFRLVFTWNGDRWGHALAVAGGGDWPPVAHSVEGGDDPARVLSPAYQQIQLREEGGRGQAFLVGRSGPHHFSAVFTVDDTSVEVDVADRCRAMVESLGCTYGISPPAPEHGADDPNRLESALNGGRLILEVVAPTRLEHSLGAVVKRARVEARIDPTTSTHRCQYRWLWSPGSPEPGQGSTSTRGH